MKTRVMLTAAMLILALGAAAAQAGEVAFVDLDRALQLTNKGKETQQKLAALKDDAELQVRQKEVELRKLQEELETQKEVLSEDAFKSKVQEFQKGMMQYQQMTQELSQKFEGQRIKLIRSFVSDLEAVTGRLARENGFKIVVLKVEDVITTSSLVIYGDPSADLTDKAVKLLNEGG
ncbi:MAG: OmpH family outer membrane protein [Deltaproteobacteria bacterium]|nr:OmpH family outer membrane protein [Deltaproteobacteria bacterium]